MLMVQDRKRTGPSEARSPTARWLPFRPNGEFGTFRFRGSLSQSTATLGEEIEAIACQSSRHNPPYLVAWSSCRSRTGRSSKPRSVPSSPPSATRCRADDYGADWLVGRTRSCDGCQRVITNGCTRQAFLHRRRNAISRNGPWCCRREGRVPRVRHRIGTTEWIANRYPAASIAVLRLRMLDQDAGAEHDCASAR